MAHIFSVNFDFNGVAASALISMHIAEEEPLFSIRFLDTVLSQSYEEGICFTGKDGYRQLDIYKESFSRELLDNIIPVIENVLQAEGDS
jgi:hypothetical protein